MFNGWFSKPSEVSDHFTKQEKDISDLLNRNYELNIATRTIMLDSKNEREELEVSKIISKLPKNMQEHIIDISIIHSSNLNTVNSYAMGTIDKLTMTNENYIAIIRKQHEILLQQEVRLTKLEQKDANKLTLGKMSILAGFSGVILLGFTGLAYSSNPDATKYALTEGMRAIKQLVGLLNPLTK